jgi:protein ImuB
MRRVMCLWLSRWPIDRRRDQLLLPDRPFVLAFSIGNQRLVSTANAAAEALGIAPGQPLADARALHPALAVAEADQAGDAAALRRLALWCNRYSPWTAPHGTDTIFLDVTGCAHLRGGEARLIQDLVKRLLRRGISCRAAIADTAGTAWSVARCGSDDSSVVPSGGERQAIAPLPIAALRLDPMLANELEQFGLRLIGDLYTLPRVALAARFGERLLERLDQALGVAAEPLSPLPPRPARWTRRRFVEPIVTSEALAKAARGLIERLCRVLSDEMLGARRLMLSCYRLDGAMAQVTIDTARPSRDPRHLFRLFAERFETIDAGLGIEDMMLAAPAVERLAAAQIRIAFSPRREETPARPGKAGEAARPEGKVFAFPAEKAAVRQFARALLAAEGRDRDGTDAAELAALVDRLANRLTPQSIRCIAPHASHVPERAQRFVPVFTPEKGVWRTNRPRPVRLLPRPEPVEAMAPVPDDPPVLFRWRRLQHRVRRADGPERICGEWWRGNEDATELRDYYRVEDEAGRRFWLYRSGLYRPQAKPRWFLHGLFA